MLSEHGACMGLRVLEVSANWSMGSWEKASQVPTLVCGTKSLALSLQALPGRRVGPHWGPTPCHPRACLYPAAPGAQAAGAKGLLQAGSGLPPSPILASLHWCPKSRGAEVAGDKHISTSLSLHIPSWAATVPGLGPNLASRSEQLLGVGRG